MNTDLFRSAISAADKDRPTITITSHTGRIHRLYCPRTSVNEHETVFVTQKGNIRSTLVIGHDDIESWELSYEVEE